MLDMRVSIKEDECHCYYCNGYGGHPYNPKVPITIDSIKRCHFCGGSGKLKKLPPTKHRRTRYDDGINYDEDWSWNSWLRRTTGE